MARSCWQCNLMDMVAQFQGQTEVPLYDTLGEEAVVWILSQTEMDIIYCENEAIPTLIKSNEKAGKFVKTIICSEEDQEMKAMCQEHEINLFCVDDLVEKGKQLGGQAQMKRISHDSVQILMQTSGSTGMPKGVTLLQSSIMAQIGAFELLHKKFNKSGACVLADGKNTEVQQSFLPQAHIYARFMEATLLFVGAEICFYRRNPKLISEDLKIQCPTLLPMVPRLLNRFYDVMSKVIESKKGIAKCLVNKAINGKMAHQQKTGRASGVWGDKITKKFAQAAGGNVRFVCTGSAPIEAEVLNKMKVFLSVQIMEG